MQSSSAEQRFHGIRYAFWHRFPRYQLTADDWKYLTDVAKETEIDTEHFEKWLYEHRGVNGALKMGGAYLVCEVYDDHFHIWPFDKK